MRANLIAFAGYAGTGKDEAAKPLIEAGYSRVCFGDIIKGQCNEMVKKHLGFSAFTEARDQKKIIRRTLESWGEDNYDAILREFFETLPEKAVNTRLVRIREAQAWVDRGGVIVEVQRPGVGPETEWSGKQLDVLQQSGLIRHVLANDRPLHMLHNAVIEMFELW